MNAEHEWVSEAPNAKLRRLLIFRETDEEKARMQHINVCPECQGKFMFAIEEKIDNID